MSSNEGSLRTVDSSLGNGDRFNGFASNRYVLDSLTGSNSLYNAGAYYSTDFRRFTADVGGIPHLMDRMSSNERSSSPTVCSSVGNGDKACAFVSNHSLFDPMIDSKFSVNAGAYYSKDCGRFTMDVGGQVGVAQFDTTGTVTPIVSVGVQIRPK